MSVAVCLRVTYASPALLADVLAALARHNAEIYRRHASLAPPWSLLWVPDQIQTCDATGCRLNDTSTLLDVIDLYALGEGSCGPLACAYAGFLATRHGDASARVELLPGVGGDVDAHHVVAATSQRIYDPQILGAS